MDNILTEEPEINSIAIDLPHDAEPEENPIPDNAVSNIEPETEVFQRVRDELLQPLTPLVHSHPNPFIGGTWKDQLTKILKQLEKTGWTRPKQIKVLEAYLYLGILIQNQPNERQQIRELIQASQGSRKAQDIWKGASRLQQIFSIRPKDLIYQTQYLTVTYIVKFTDKEYQSLIKNLQSKFL